MADKIVYARACPERIWFEETYYYDQVISRNPSNRSVRAPVGRIEINIPYDGQEFFPRRAVSDVERQLGANMLAPAVALIGHLAVSSAGRTDLEERLELGDHYGSVPLMIPVSGGELTRLDQLTDDTRTCHITHCYTPLAPELLPIDVTMELLDEELVERMALNANTPEELADAASRIAQQTNFLRNLVLGISITVHLPKRLASDATRLTIRRVALSWPTITSLRGLHLFSDAGYELTLRYNPTTRSLEWHDIELSPQSSPNASDVQSYISTTVFLKIEQAGELYREDRLNGEIEVVIPGGLLSGVSVRYYDATGARADSPAPAMQTRLIDNVHMVLDDAFSRRLFSPYQHIHFNEVIPDEMRVRDIRSALEDRGFRVERDIEIPHGREDLRHFLWAQRPEGPETMALWIVVEGKRYVTTRQTQVPGGQIYTSQLDSGELRIYMRGELPGNNHGLVREMNALQTALRDRFERLKAKR